MNDILIISDTSCLIALDRINQLDILKGLFKKIITTDEVKEEFGKKLPKWIQIVKVQNKAKMQELEDILDKGEASAIALALETEMRSILIIDERKGRNVARNLKIEILGTLKVIQLAKERGIIKSIHPVIESLQQAGFRFSKKIIEVLTQQRG